MLPEAEVRDVMSGAVVFVRADILFAVRARDPLMQGVRLMVEEDIHLSLHLAWNLRASELSLKHAPPAARRTGLPWW